MDILGWRSRLYVHRYKRPPRKKQAVTLPGPAIVTTTSLKQLKLRRAARALQDDGREADPEVKAFLARMIRPGGALPPEKF